MVEILGEPGPAGEVSPPRVRLLPDRDVVEEQLQGLSGAGSLEHEDDLGIGEEHLVPIERRE